MIKQSGGRIGPIAAISGSVTLLVGTYLHPMNADPNIPRAAFAEYAADQLWVASHLTQLLGVILIVAALVLLAQRMADGPAADWASLAMAGAIASLAVASALQAVDGVALKVMVNTWAAAPETERAALFQAAFGVRQIETGLAAISSLLFGLTIATYGIALLLDGRFSKRLGAIAIAGGTPTAVAGVAIAYTGFSDLSMVINMSSGLLLIVWMVLLGVHTWRQSSASPQVPAADF